MAGQAVDSDDPFGFLPLSGRKSELVTIPAGPARLAA
jgi:hypothetical protein